MDIPTYATCSGCETWIEDKCDWTRGTCEYAESQAKEGMIQAGVQFGRVQVAVPWNAKPCSEWEPTNEARRDIDIQTADEAPDPVGRPVVDREWAAKAVGVGGAR